MILVCGIGASGTSAVAGALHKMGVPMGHEAHMGQHPAGFGLYEDAEFYGAFTRATSTHLWRLLQEHAQEPIFGIKNTLAFKSLGWLPIILGFKGWDLRIVAVHRALMDSARGREEGRCPPGMMYSREDARRWALTAMHEYTKALLPIDKRSLYNVQYEWMIRDPVTEVTALAAFTFEGLDAEPDVKAGIAHIERRP